MEGINFIGGKKKITEERELPIDSNYLCKKKVTSNKVVGEVRFSCFSRKEKKREKHDQVQEKPII